MLSVLRRVLAEPLLQFGLIAGLLLLLRAWWVPAADPRPLVVVGPEELTLAVADWRERHGRAPSVEELAAIRDELAAEALLLAEAEDRELGRHDPELRGRLLDLAVLQLAGDAPEPDEATLRDWYRQQPERWRGEERLVLEQLPLGEAPAAPLLRRLEAGAEPTALETPGVATTLGPLSRSELAARLGEDFASAVWALPEEQWSGPLRSQQDRHLVRALRRFAAAPPSFEDLRYVLAEAWQREAFAQRRAQAVAALRERYRLELPALAEPAP